MIKKLAPNSKASTETAVSLRFIALFSLSCCAEFVRFSIRVHAGPGSLEPLQKKGHSRYSLPSELRYGQNETPHLRKLFNIDRSLNLSLWYLSVVVPKVRLGDTVGEEAPKVSDLVQHRRGK